MLKKKEKKGCQHYDMKEKSYGQGWNKIYERSMMGSKWQNLFTRPNLEQIVRITDI